MLGDYPSQIIVLCVDAVIFDFPTSATGGLCDAYSRELYKDFYFVFQTTFVSGAPIWKSWSRKMIWCEFRQDKEQLNGRSSLGAWWFGIVGINRFRGQLCQHSRPTAPTGGHKSLVSQRRQLFFAEFVNNWIYRRSGVLPFLCFPNLLDFVDSTQPPCVAGGMQSGVIPA